MRYVPKAFRLRTMLLAMSLLGCAIAMVATPLHRYHAEQRVFTELPVAPSITFKPAHATTQPPFDYSVLM